jgi:cell division protein FtsN
MLEKRQHVIFLLFCTLFVLFLAGCAEAYQKYQDPNYVPSIHELTRIAVEISDDNPLKPTAEAIALQRFATAQAAGAAMDAAQATADAARAVHDRQVQMMTVEAQQTQQAHQRHLEQQWQWATQQAANATQVYQATQAGIAAQATTEARHLYATRTQQAYEQTATKVSVNETATVTAANATSTVQARRDGLTATAEAIALEEKEMELQREKWLQPFRIILPVLAVLALAAAVGWLGWRFAQVAEDRARVIRPKADEGEMVWVLDRFRMAQPRRLPPYVNLRQGEEQAPEMGDDPDRRERRTARQQRINLEQAKLTDRITAARRRKRRKDSGQPTHPLAHPLQPALMRPAPTKSTMRQKKIPGIRNVSQVRSLSEAAERGLLTPSRADVLEGQWRVISE